MAEPFLTDKLPIDLQCKILRRCSRCAIGTAQQVSHSWNQQCRTMALEWMVHEIACLHCEASLRKSEKKRWASLVVRLHGMMREDPSNAGLTEEPSWMRDVVQMERICKRVTKLLPNHHGAWAFHAKMQIDGFEVARSYRRAAGAALRDVPPKRRFYLRYMLRALVVALKSHAVRDGWLLLLFGSFFSPVALVVYVSWSRRDVQLLLQCHRSLPSYACDAIVGIMSFLRRPPLWVSPLSFGTAGVAALRLLMHSNSRPPIQPATTRR